MRCVTFFYTLSTGFPRFRRNRSVLYHCSRRTCRRRIANETRRQRQRRTQAWGPVAADACPFYDSGFYREDLIPHWGFSREKFGVIAKILIFVFSGIDLIDPYEISQDFVITPYIWIEQTNPVAPLLTSLQIPPRSFTWPAFAVCGLAKVCRSIARGLGKNSCFPSDRQPSGKHRWLIQPANSERTGRFFCFDASEGWDIQLGAFSSRWHRYGKGLLRRQTGGYNIPWRVLLEAWQPKPSP